MLTLSVASTHCTHPVTLTSRHPRLGKAARNNAICKLMNFCSGLQLSRLGQKGFPREWQEGWSLPSCAGWDHRASSRELPRGASHCCPFPASLSLRNSSARGSIFPAVTLCKASPLHMSCVTSVSDSCSPVHSWISPGTQGVPVEHTEPAIPTHSQQPHPSSTSHSQLCAIHIF